MAKEHPIPTLRSMLRVAESFQTDRLTMVRSGAPLRPDREPGVFVLMIGEQAVRDLGPLCIEAAAKMVDEGVQPSRIGALQPDDDVSAWFDKMEADRIYFSWGKQVEPFIMFAFLLGGEVAEWIAPRLREHHCACEIE